MSCICVSLGLGGHGVQEVEHMEKITRSFPLPGSEVCSVCWNSRNRRDPAWLSLRESCSLTTHRKGPRGNPISARLFRLHLGSKQEPLLARPLLLLSQQYPCLVTSEGWQPVSPFWVGQCRCWVPELSRNGSWSGDSSVGVGAHMVCRARSGPGEQRGA